MPARCQPHRRHPRRQDPHIQNLAVGGVANPINLDAPSVLNLERLLYVKSFIDRLGEFIEQVYKVDAAIIAAHYPEWLNLGRGPSTT